MITGRNCAKKMNLIGFIECSALSFKAHLSYTLAFSEKKNAKYEAIRQTRKGGHISACTLNRKNGLYCRGLGINDPYAIYSFEIKPIWQLCYDRHINRALRDTRIQFELRIQQEGQSCWDYRLLEIIRLDVSSLKRWYNKNAIDIIEK